MYVTHRSSAFVYSTFCVCGCQPHDRCLTNVYGCVEDSVRSKHRRKKKSLRVHGSNRALGSLKGHVWCLGNLKIKFRPHLPFAPSRVSGAPHVPVLEHSILRGNTFHSQKPGRGNLLGKWGQNRSEPLFPVVPSGSWAMTGIRSVWWSLKRRTVCLFSLFHGLIKRSFIQACHFQADWWAKESTVSACPNSTHFSRTG